MRNAAMAIYWKHFVVQEDEEEEEEWMGWELESYWYNRTRGAGGGGGEGGETKPVNDRESTKRFLLLLLLWERKLNNGVARYAYAEHLALPARANSIRRQVRENTVVLLLNKFFFLYFHFSFFNQLLYNKKKIGVFLFF